MYYIGLDISKQFFDACLLIDGKEKTQRFDNDIDGIIKLLAWIQKHTETQDGLIVCMEATGNYYEEVADYLCHYYPVNVANPGRVKKYGESVFQRTKSDKADAKLIANYAQSMHINKKLDYRKAPTGTQYTITRTISLLNQLISQRTAQTNQQKSAKEGHVIQIWQTQIEQTTKAIKETKAIIKQLIKSNKAISDQVKNLESISGIGYLTAASLLMNLLVKDFKNQRQFTAWLGLSPHRKDSGNSTNNGSLTRYGHRKARASLFMSAMAVYRNNCFPQFIGNMRRHGKKPMVIITAIMRKLAVIAYNIFKTGQPFDKGRYEQALRISIGTAKTNCSAC